MANSKISALTSAATPLAGTETLPVVQSSTTKQVSVANLTVGRTVTMNVLSVDSTTTDTSTFSTNQSYTFNRYTNTGGSARTWYIQTAGTAFNIADQTAGYLNRISIDTSGNVSFSTGNLVQGTAAKGINFTANTPAAGKTSQLLNWYEEGTWTPTGTNIVIVGTPTYTGSYTRIGRMVYVNLRIQSTGSTSSVAGTSYINLGFPFVSANIYTTGSAINLATNATLGNSVYGLSGGNTIVYLPSWTTLADVLLTGYYFV
jgi:hypothetical protein